MQFRHFCGLLSVALVINVTTPVWADRVVTEDGRVLVAKKAREIGGNYVLEFEHGTITVPKGRHIKAVEIEGDMSDYVPANDDEREKLAKGFVRYRGKWLHQVEYEALLRKESEKSREAAEAAAAHSEWHNARRKETKHFVVLSNTSPELLDFYSELLEAYWSLMDERIGIDPTPTMKRTKMTVNIYKSDADFHKLSGEENSAVLGFFMPSAQTLNFYHDYAEPEQSEWVALHECTHLLTYLIDQDYIPQIWLNEAVADYFGSSEIEREKSGKIKIKPGKLQTDRVLTVQQALQEGKAIELEQLFFIHRDNFEGFEYAHAWSFVYFLNNHENGKYAKGFAKFFKELYTTAKGVPFTIENTGGKTGSGKLVKPEDIRDLLLKRIGEKDVAALGKAWHDAIAKIVIDAPAARLKRGISSVFQLNFEEALADLDAAIEAGIEDPRAYWARARALGGVGLGNILKRDPKATEAATPAPQYRKRTSAEARTEAAADLDRAIELSPLNALFRYEKSLQLLGRAAFVTYGEEAKKFDNAEAKAQAGLAHELDPENEEYKLWLSNFQ